MEALLKVILGGYGLRQFCEFCSDLFKHRMYVLLFFAALGWI